MNSIRSKRWRIVQSDCIKLFTLGTHRFQRAVVGKDVSIGIGFPGVASLTSSDYRLQSRTSDPKRAAGHQWIFQHACTLEAMRTQGFSAGGSDVLPKRKNVDRKGWDIQSKAGKISEKRDEKLDGDQPAAVGTRSHRRNSRRAEEGDEIGIEPARGGD